LIDAAGVNSTVTNGSLAAAMPLAALAGLVSFLSPCVLPLVPGYLSYVTGLTGVDLEEQKRGRMLAGCLLFVLGFSFVFVTYGLAMGSLGHWMAEERGTIMKVLGAMTIVFGLVFMGLLPGLQRTFKSGRRPAVGLVGAPMLGVLFGFGWTPCVGPTLGAIESLAFLQGEAARGGILAFGYCLGLGVPFILTALGYRKALGLFGTVKRHYRLVMRIGGGMLVALGVLLVTGVWQQTIATFQTWVGGTGWVI
jgi:cytochrome c-type biogenesis protein